MFENEECLNAGLIFSFTVWVIAPALLSVTILTIGIYKNKAP